MKIISKLLIILILSFWTLNISTNAGFFDNLISDSQPKLDIKCDWWDCNLQSWIENVKDSVNWIETDRTLSEYIQDIVVYILSFISIIAVIYIIYAWFRILTWAWDEEVLKKQKSTILYVIIWIAVIWLAYPITLFIINLLNSTPNP